MHKFRCTLSREMNRFQNLPSTTLTLLALYMQGCIAEDNQFAVLADEQTSLSVKSNALVVAEVDRNDVYPAVVALRDSTTAETFSGVLLSPKLVVTVAKSLTGNVPECASGTWGGAVLVRLETSHAMSEVNTATWQQAALDRKSVV